MDAKFPRRRLHSARCLLLPGNRLYRAFAQSRRYGGPGGSIPPATATGDGTSAKVQKTGTLAVDEYGKYDHSRTNSAVCCSKPSVRCHVL